MTLLSGAAIVALSTLAFVAGYQALAHRYVQMRVDSQVAKMRRVVAVNEDFNLHCAMPREDDTIALRRAVAIVKALDPMRACDPYDPSEGRGGQEECRTHQDFMETRRECRTAVNTARLVS